MDHSDPAFPSNTWPVTVGMSLRDYFAGQALVGLLACGNTSGVPMSFATWAYEQADAMLVAREGK